MKNKSKLLVLSLIGIFGLTACNNEIVAKPKNYDNPLIEVTDYTQEIYNNLESVVADKVHTEGLGEEVLNQILYLYSVNAFGAYDASVVAGGVKVKTGEVSLSAAVVSQANMNLFVKAHKTYWDDPDAETHAEYASETETARVKEKLNSINNRIAKKMYDKISGGSYSDRHIFSEYDFLKSLKGSLESVENPTETVKAQCYKKQILPAVEPENVFDPINGLLHKDFYQSKSNTYVVDKIVPEIYRELLAELYLNTETYNSLGRSYARKVNIIKFANNDNYPNSAYYLANDLVNQINKKKSEYSLNDDLLVEFKKYSNAYIGVAQNGSDEDNILMRIHDDVDNTAFNFDEVATDNVGYFRFGTNYGDLAEKYLKMLANPGAATSDLFNSFTDTNKYPTYVGLALQKMGLQENDYTTNGWFIKNGGLTELPEAIRSRLFNIAVATGVKETKDERDAVERVCNETTGEWTIPDGENAYVCRINGHNFLKKASRVKGESVTKDILHYDNSSKTYYIVEIVEAVSSSKLSKNPNSTNNYAKLRGASDMEKIINEVGQIVATGESYSTLATKKYLKDMVISYHDDTVYNYFKNTYPELFE